MLVPLPHCEYKSSSVVGLCVAVGVEVEFAPLVSLVVLVPFTCSFSFSFSRSSSLAVRSLKTFPRSRSQSQITSTVALHKSHVTPLIPSLLSTDPRLAHSNSPSSSGNWLQRTFLKVDRRETSWSRSQGAKDERLR